MWLETIFWCLLCSYAVFTLSMWRIWKGIGARGADDQTLFLKPDPQPEVSVVIAVRNESAYIRDLLTDLEQQNLPVSQFEILIVDDASDDGTVSIVRSFAAVSPLSMHLIPLTEKATAAPKKRAVQTAIALAKGRLILCTDGDCRVPSGWISSFLNYHRTSGAKCISGPVTFTPELYLTDIMQTVEFASLIGAGACTLEAGYPTMCNGANLAYTRDVFAEVGGFEGSDHLASGDDEFLMHKIAGRFPGSVHFLKAADAIVQTVPHRRWKDFVRQRRRWASKWKHYRSIAPQLLAVYIFLANAAVLIAVGMFAAGSLSGYTLAALLLLKFLPEWLFLGSMLRFLKKAHTLWYLPVVQFVYPWYVVLFGLTGQQEGYQWKGRELK